MLSELFEISLDELIKGDRSLQGKVKVKGGTGMFSNRSLLSALNYFSLFFAPLIFPLITLIFGYKEMKKHGKRAFIFQLIPTLTLIVIAISYYISAKLAGTKTPNYVWCYCMERKRRCQATKSINIKSGIIRLNKSTHLSFRRVFYFLDTSYNTFYVN